MVQTVCSSEMENKGQIFVVLSWKKKERLPEKSEFRDRISYFLWRVEERTKLKKQTLDKVQRIKKA